MPVSLPFDLFEPRFHFHAPLWQKWSKRASEGEKTVFSSRGFNDFQSDLSSFQNFASEEKKEEEFKLIRNALKK